MRFEGESEEQSRVRLEEAWEVISAAFNDLRNELERMAVRMFFY